MITEKILHESAGFLESQKNLQKNCGGERICRGSFENRGMNGGYRNGTLITAGNDGK